VWECGLKVGASPGTSPPPGGGRIQAGRHALLRIAVFLLFLAVAVGLQWRGGAYHSEFASQSDEPAHYVTGLMVRDFVAGLGQTPPLEFAETYYLHYPKVAIGHWPPVFYVVQAAWTLPFSASRTSILLLMATLAALLALLVCDAATREYSLGYGIGAGLLMLSIPLVQVSSRAVMAEVLVTIFALLATLAFGRYLRTANWRDSLWFGVWASLAIMTKGTGIALALVPPISVLITGRLGLVRRFSFCLSALLVAVLCGPWYCLMPGAQHEAVLKYGGFGMLIRSPANEVAEIARYAGMAVGLLALVGLVERTVRAWRRAGCAPMWGAAVAFAVSVVAMRLSVPTSYSSRNLMLLVPPLMLFSLAGVQFLLRTRLAARVSSRSTAAVLVVGASILFVWNLLAVDHKPYFGYSQVARDLVSQAAGRSPVVLVSSDPRGEGALISEIAMLDERPGFMVLRGHKMLANSRWQGGGYELLYQTPEEQMRFLEAVPVDTLVMDMSSRGAPAHQKILEETVKRYPDRWRLAGLYPKNAGGENSEREIRVYRLAGFEPKPLSRIRSEIGPGILQTIGR